MSKGIQLSYWDLQALRQAIKGECQQRTEALCNVLLRNVCQLITLSFLVFFLAQETGREVVRIRSSCAWKISPWSPNTGCLLTTGKSEELVLRDTKLQDPGTPRELGSLCVTSKASCGRGHGCPPSKHASFLLTKSTLVQVSGENAQSPRRQVPVLCCYQLNCVPPKTYILKR